MTFVKKNKLGQSGENLLMELLVLYGYEKVSKNSDFEKRYDYDVFIVEPFVTFECKYDFMAKKTGNIAIEYHNSKKNEPSGLARSLADFWIHIIDDEHNEPLLYIGHRKLLLDFLAEKKPHKNIIAGGDNNSNMSIYKKSDILSSEICNDKPLILMSGEVLKKMIGERK